MSNLASPIFRTVAVASGATPDTPPGGVIYIFQDSTGAFKQINDQGVVSAFGGGGGAGTVTSVGSTDGSVTITSPTTTPDLSVSAARLAASWTLGICRVYAVDGANGNDSNKGYADPATNSAADYAIACQAAGAVAVKTFAGLSAILPRVGAGRICEVVIRAGTYVGGLQTFLGGVVGYQDGIPTIRTTDTVATAGCVAFDGSLADCTALGMTTATGMNAAGYNPTGSPTTSVVQCLKVGGAAPGFTATEVAAPLPLGARVRFDSATTTAALRNVCRLVSKVSGTDTLTWTSVLPAVPVASDTFYIESPAVNVPATQLGENSQVPTGNFSNIVGINFTGALTLRGGLWNWAGCAGTTGSYRNGTFVASTAYGHPVRGFLTVGGSRFSSTTTVQTTLSTSAFSGLVSAGAFTATNPVLLANLAGLVCGAGFVLNDGALGSQGISLGSSAATVGVPVRITGPQTEAGLHVNGSMKIGSLDITNMGAKPAIWIESSNVVCDLGSGVAAGGPVTGSTGNTDVGLDLTRARNCVIVVQTGNLPTVTGSNGDVRIADGGNGQIITWAQAGAGFIDSAGNRFITTTLNGGLPTPRGPIGPVAKFSGGILGGAGATTSYLSDTGVAPAANLTAIEYPVSGFLAMRLRVKPEANTFATNVVATVYKNNVATAITVTIPAGSTAVVSDTSHAVVFSDGDTLSVVLSNAADAGKTATIMAVVEGPH